MENNLLYLWLGLSVILFVIDLISLTIVLFFASIAALSVGGAIYFDILEADNLQSHLMTFFAAYALWAAILYKPLRNLKTRLQHKGGYQDMIGSQAIVTKEISDASHLFQVKWSGTVMNAQLVDDAKNNTITPGDVVEIVSVKGATLIVKPQI